MPVNVGSTDRIARVIVGVVVLVGGYYFGSPWGLVGLIPLVTAAVGWCPLYTVCKFNSCQTKN